jgi:hypothetical protein
MKKALIMIFAALIMQSCEGYKEIAEIPVAYRGGWQDEEARIYVTANTLIVSGRIAHRCKAEKILLGSKKLAVVCDQASTKAAQRGPTSLGINSPSDYRTTYIFDVSGNLPDVSYTQYMSKGTSDSEGTFTLRLLTAASHD